MTRDALREHVAHALASEDAHMAFEEAVRGIRKEQRGARVPRVPHTVWRLVEHVRIAQHDLLEFCRSAEHVSPPWPDGYWPSGDAPPDAAAWSRSLAAFLRDRRALVALIRDPATDLLAPLPWARDSTVLSSALLAADHTSYHLGQIVLIRRALPSRAR